MPELAREERERYDRQMMIDGWGEEGQRRLKEATAFVAGVGGLGCPVSTYLAAAGVGEIRLCDADRIELSNLNRQVHYTPGQIGHFKAEAATERLHAMNPSIRIEGFTEFLEEGNIERIAGNADIVLDCLDNFETRYLLNRYCFERKIPLVHGAVWGLGGQVAFLNPPRTPCLRCLFPEPPPRSVFPVLGAAPGVVGCLQAMEALKWLAGLGAGLEGWLMILDGEEMEWRRFRLRKSPGCPVCGG